LSRSLSCIHFTSWLYLFFNRRTLWCTVVFMFLVVDLRPEHTDLQRCCMLWKLGLRRRVSKLNRYSGTSGDGGTVSSDDMPSRYPGSGVVVSSETRRETAGHLVWSASLSVRFGVLVSMEMCLACTFCCGEDAILLTMVCWKCTGAELWYGMDGLQRPLRSFPNNAYVQEQEQGLESENSTGRPSAPCSRLAVL